MIIFKYILFAIVILSSSFGQSFGKNKVQYRDFDWSYIQTPNFDIYFYGDNQDLAEFTSRVSEEAYKQISTHLAWDLKNRVSILVYNSHNEFQQTNVVGVYMSEGIGGVTELFKNRVVSHLTEILNNLDTLFIMSLFMQCLMIWFTEALLKTWLLVELV